MAKQVSPGVLALRKVVDDVYADAREAKKQGKLVGWSSSKFPCELAEAFDLNVMYPENQAAGIAAQRDGEIMCQAAEDLGFDIEYLYDNYIDEAYPSYALTLSYIGIGVQILLLAISLILMYGYSGIVSSVSILVGSLIQVLIFSFLGFEFTPVTIAAVSLTMILAAFVQYNYFERIKSELKKGRGIAKSNSEGYRKSFVVTLDSSAVVFIASLFAFIFGKGMIRPFAGVSLIGSLVVFLIVNYLSKWMMYWMVTAPYFNKKENTFGIKAISDKEVKKLNKPYKEIAKGYKIMVKNTGEATDLIKEFPEIFRDYEILKGTMDDTFINVTGKKLGD